MSVWMVLELNSMSWHHHDLSRHIVKLLDTARMGVKKRLMCLHMLRSWLYELDMGEQGQQLRNQLRDSGAMQSLVKTMVHGGPAIAREALLSLATLVSASDKLKSSFEARIGFEKLSHLVGESALSQPRPTFDLVVIEAFFQMASLGPIEGVPHDSNVQTGIVSLNFRMAPKLSPWLLQCNAILNIRRPAPLFVAKLTSSHMHESQASGMLSAADTANAETYAKSESASLSRRSEGSSRTGGHRRGASISSLTSDKARPKSISSLSSDGVEQNLDDFDLHHSEMDEVTYAQLFGAARSKYIFRSIDAAKMMLLLVQHVDVEAQLLMLETLRHVLQADPENSYTFSKMQALSTILNMSHPHNDFKSEVQNSCMETMAMIGQYDISPHELSALIQHATPSLPQEDNMSVSDVDDDFRLRVLHAMGLSCTSCMRCMRCMRCELCVCYGSVLHLLHALHALHGLRAMCLSCTLAV